MSDDIITRALIVAGLDTAAAALRGALARLDRGAHNCEACGLKKKANWTEYQAAEEIEGMIRKLEKWQANLKEARHA